MCLKEELGKLCYRRKEVEELERRLRELQSRATGCVRRLTGLPGSGFPADSTGEYAAALLALKEELAGKREACLREIEALDAFVEEIEDPLMRLVIIYRYLYGYSWTQIAMKLGGGNTPDGVRMAHNRFLKRYEQNKNVRSVRSNPLN